jgi:TonB family protein
MLSFPSLAQTAPADYKTPGVTRPVMIPPPHSCFLDPKSREEVGPFKSIAVTFLVLTDGSTANATVETSSGFSDLDKIAVACVMRWRYLPAKLDGAPVEFSNKAYVEWRNQ